METEVARVKQDRVLSQNQIREIVMDLDNDKEKYYVCEEMDEEEPGPLREGLPLHSLQTQIFLPAALKLRMMLVM
jgi:hypothetical protein